MGDLFTYDDQSSLAACSDGFIRIINNMPLAFAGYLPEPRKNGIERLVLNYKYDSIATLSIDSKLQIQPLSTDIIESAVKVRKSNMHKRVNNQDIKLKDKDK